MNAKICVRNLTVSYQQNKQLVSAINDISFDIEAGEFVCILGHSGCGKSTLLRVLAGLMNPSGGNVYIDGQTIEGTGSNCSMVFQQYSLFPWMSVRDNVAFGIEQAFGKKKKESSRLAERYLEEVSMLRDADKYPYQLSGGMRQRVAIARSLAMDSEIMLLDEPFGALDTKTRRQLQQLLVNLWKKKNSSTGREKTIVFVTHDIEEAMLLADRIFFMANGQIKSVTDISFARPRDKDVLSSDAEFIKKRTELENLFYIYGDMVNETAS